MGFGYWVYKIVDFCFNIIKDWVRKFVEKNGEMKLFVIVEMIEKLMWDEKKFFLNFDFFVVFVYYLMKILILLFMFIFVCLWIIGWVVYVIE